ncbi:hypothetical protein ACFTY8_49060 [Streptomyces mirabilis]|uniref:hypothetical protein n=1 Tax=Streptomyces mirabilis TaxID=68239 RepID=UPI00363560DF
MRNSWQARRDCIEEILGPTRDALEQLQELEYESKFTKGPSGRFKNLIFAADGAKPEIVLRDAVNNDVEIVRNADTCLVFSDPLPPQGLTWRQMIAWWIKNHEPDSDETAAAGSLFRRLYRSLDSPPEQLVMITYCARYAQPDGLDLPALIPQVYLHYDPYTRKSGKQSGRRTGQSHPGLAQRNHRQAGGLRHRGDRSQQAARAGHTRPGGAPHGPPVCQRLLGKTACTGVVLGLF